MASVPFKCECGVDCLLEYEPPTGPAVLPGAMVSMAPCSPPRSLRHCLAGSVVTNIVAKVIRFQVQRAGEWVDAVPLLSEWEPMQ
jgi:hypothetical protein